MRATMVLPQILLCSVACAVAVFLSTRGNTFVRSRAPRARAARLGLVLWPALALAVASPAGVRQVSAVNDPLLSISVRDSEDALLAMRALRARGIPSAIVPTLQVQPVILAPTAATRSWNVVIVMLESARARDTTVYTPTLNTTPFLAQLARESLVVDNMYAAIPRTTDAWISILAGRYASSDRTVGSWAERHPQVIPSSMAPLLRARGYASAFFLPTTLNFGADAAVVRALGFDQVVTKESIPEPASGLVTAFGWEDRVLLPPIGRWLDQRVSDKRPFLLAVMTNVGHAPFELPPGYHMQHFPKNRPETFDLSSDRMERRNIAAQLSSRDEAQARIDMLAWRDRAAETFQAEVGSGPIGSEGTNQ